MRALLTALLAVALLLAAALPAKADIPGFQKTLPLNAEELGKRKLGAVLGLARSAGVTQIQDSATWWYMSRGPRKYDWSALDRLVAKAKRRGMRVVLQLHGTPDWVHPGLASTVPSRMERIWYPPVRNPSELDRWTRFVSDVARRYRGQIAHYEIWNEPNLHKFWRPGPDVDAYARLLRAAYYAVNAADPKAAVVFGGMTRNDFGYLRSYYDSVERQWPAEAAANRYFFDILGVHPYSDNRSPLTWDEAYIDGEVDRNFLGFRHLKFLMDSREAPGKPVYIGEYGFSTTDTWMPAVPDRTRADHLRNAYALAASEGYVTGLSWYSFLPDSANGPEWSIVSRKLRPSRTFRALRKVKVARPGP